MVLKELILTLAILGRFHSCERTDFYQFLIWDGVKVVKELIFNSLYIGRVWWS